LRIKRGTRYENAGVLINRKEIDEAGKRTRFAFICGIIWKRQLANNVNFYRYLQPLGMRQRNILYGNTKAEVY